MSYGEVYGRASVGDSGGIAWVAKTALLGIEAGMTKTLQVVSEVDRQIAEIKTTPEANDLRKKIKAIQALAPKRHESYETAFNGGRSFCEVSAKAGKLWAEVENKTTPGGDHCKKIDNGISAIDAGFANRQDAMMCTRLSELTPEEREAYYHKCQNDDKIFPFKTF